MPDHSIVSKQRDVYGELGWIPNFHVKLSKNNSLRHNTYKEFFDAPRDYHETFHQISSAWNNFMRENALESRKVNQKTKSNRTKTPKAAYSSQAIFPTKKCLNATERLSFS